MKDSSNFIYTPLEYEMEKASQSYLMSLISMIVGLPLPIINLLATALFFLLNRRESFFIRWHCTQALLAQLSVFFLNSSLFWWSISIIFFEEKFSFKYLAYLIFIVVFNLVEIISTIVLAINVRKGIHTKLWVYGWLTDKICKQRSI